MSAWFETINLKGFAGALSRKLLKGDETPDVCTACAQPQACFELLAENQQRIYMELTGIVDRIQH